MDMPVGRTYRAMGDPGPIAEQSCPPRIMDSRQRELVFWDQAHTNMAPVHVSEEGRDGPISSCGAGDGQPHCAAGSNEYGSASLRETDRGSPLAEAHR